MTIKFKFVWRENQNDDFVVTELSAESESEAIFKFTNDFVGASTSGFELLYWQRKATKPRCPART